MSQDTKILRITRREIREMPERTWQSWLDRIASGESLARICEKEYYVFGIARREIAKNPEREAELQAAERIYADFHFAQCIPLADAAEDKDQALVKKLQIDTRMRVAAKLNRERYGDQGGVTMNLGANSLVSILSGLPRSDVPAIDAPKD